ncbi:MAG TPA: hypothetical protein ENN27_02935 [Candidatus Atribacteria bacterium]|nr:hypothetical protein [Candidatus Atribacteria bacterium]
MKSKKEKIEPEILETNWQKEARQRITELSKQPYRRYTEPVFGEYPYRAQLESSLGKYIGRETPELYRAGESELLKTLQGEYDPYTSPYYQAMREGALREEKEALGRLRRGAQLGGYLYGTPRLNAEAELLAQTQAELAKLLGGMSEAERIRRLSTVPTAIDVGRQIEGIPLESMQAIMSISPILKALEEEPLRFGYEQFREEQMWPYQRQAPLLQQLLGYAPWYMPQYVEKPSVFSQIMGTASRLLPTIIK